MWTDLNVVVFHGSDAARKLIKKHEWEFDKYPHAKSKRKDIVYKFEVIITTYEVVLSEANALGKIEWQYLVIDEGHRLKNIQAKLAAALHEFEAEHKLVLTGTPLQNNIRELWAILHFLNQEAFPEDESKEWIEKFGSLTDATQVEELQEVLKPYMLRRMKEDVEKNIPQKQETIVEIEMTKVQKIYYKAVHDQNREVLCEGLSRKNRPNLVNILMELRKICNHPFLVKGAEEKILATWPNISDPLVSCSAKMIVLFKLLTKLKAEGSRVLIFSQMVALLDIVEDFMVEKEFAFERIDGGVGRAERQLAIDRFCDKTNKEAFAFLLSTRAGGLGLNLVAADTVIIFDSDWNPQNDLQAQARAHRIGQTKEVKIYRFVTRNSYERYMLHVASKKLGLEEVVLHQDKPEKDTDEDKTSLKKLSNEEIDRILKHGAYDMYNETEGAAEKAEEVLVNEDIDSVLARSVTISHGAKTAEEGKEGGLSANLKKLSKVSYATSAHDLDIDLKDDNFWKKILPEAQNVKSLTKRWNRKNKNWLEDEEQRKKFVKDIAGVVEQIREKERSNEFGYTTNNMEMSALLRELQTRSEFTEEEKEELAGYALLVQEKKRVRAVQEEKNAGKDILDENDEPFEEKKRAQNKKESIDDKRERLCGTWNKTNFRLLKQNLLALGYGRWDTITESASLVKTKEVEQVRAMCECFSDQLIKRGEFQQKVVEENIRFLNSVDLKPSGKWYEEEEDNPLKITMRVDTSIGERGVYPGHALDVYVKGPETEADQTVCGEALKKLGGEFYIVITAVDDDDVKNTTTTYLDRMGIVRYRKIDKNMLVQRVSGNEEFHLKMYCPGFPGKYKIQMIWLGAAEAKITAEVVQSKKGKRKSNTLGVRSSRRFGLCSEALSPDDETKPFLLPVESHPGIVEEGKDLKPSIAIGWGKRLALMDRIKIIASGLSLGDPELGRLPVVLRPILAWWWNATGELDQSGSIATDQRDDQKLIQSIHKYGYGRMKEIREDDEIGWSAAGLKERLKPLWNKLSDEQKKTLDFEGDENIDTDDSITIWPNATNINKRLGKLVELYFKPQANMETDDGEKKGRKRKIEERDGEENKDKGNDRDKDKDEEKKDKKDKKKRPEKKRKTDKDEKKSKKKDRKDRKDKDKKKRDKSRDKDRKERKSKKEDKKNKDDKDSTSSSSSNNSSGTKRKQETIKEAFAKKQKIDDLKASNSGNSSSSSTTSTSGGNSTSSNSGRKKLERMDDDRSKYDKNRGGSSNGGNSSNNNSNSGGGRSSGGGSSNNSNSGGSGGRRGSSDRMEEDNVRSDKNKNGGMKKPNLSSSGGSSNGSSSSNNNSKSSGGNNNSNNNGGSRRGSSDRMEEDNVRSDKSKSAGSNKKSSSSTNSSSNSPAQSSTPRKQQQATEVSMTL
eukprot:TRINITY_DN530_c0_g1_i3.p1 TRINITY_DN530_c0_g1~~TRINITY_DN530_c0_g1_i3.p1  ORF type:complete len:1581 (-),score=597.97 TRINITY_DN530_c0_g1_i3:89-4312(-)